jgi:uncharacterized protein YndB with AHSA1/START domain
METDNSIIFTKTFNASPEAVWKAWTDPEMIKKWWGPEGFTAPSAKVDLKVGGKYVYAMQGPAGSEWDRVMYSAGVFKEIIPYKKIVVTDYFSDAEGNMIQPSEEGQDPNFPEETIVTVLFEEVDSGRTKLSVIYPKPETAEQLDAMKKSGMEEGWMQTLNKLQIALQ